jgi:hypothetical protein
MASARHHADGVVEQRERLLLAALADEVRTIHLTFFGGGLTMPLLALDDATDRLAGWDRRHRTLTVSRRFVTTASWVAVREVLKHECAHQFVDEVLEIHDETAHGPTFRRVCEDKGIDPRSAGVVVEGPALERDGEIDRVLRRVEKLLALATSDNACEAEAAANAAQRLMLEHNLAVLGRPRRYVVRALGRPVGRMHAHEKLLGVLLSKHYFVDVIIVRAWMHAEGRMGSVVEVAGATENVDMAEWVHAFLLGAAERTWQEQARARGLAPRERLPFFAGFMMGVGDSLGRGARASAEKGLVWVGDADLADFVHRRHPRVRRGRIGGQLRDGHAAGREAGQDVVIHKPVATTHAHRGRLLGS